MKKEGGKLVPIEPKLLAEALPPVTYKPDEETEVPFDAQSVQKYIRQEILKNQAKTKALLEVQARGVEKQLESHVQRLERLFGKSQKPASEMKRDDEVKVPGSKRALPGEDYSISLGEIVCFPGPSAKTIIFH